MFLKFVGFLFAFNGYSLDSLQRYVL